MGTVRIEDAGPHIKRITLDRPERLNAISFELAADVHAALDVIAADADCRVAVLTGAGRGFCAGLDLKDWGEPPRPGDPNANVAIGGQEFIANMTMHMRATPQIIVAAVNGVAYVPTIASWTKPWRPPSRSLPTPAPGCCSPRKCCGPTSTCRA